MESKLVGWGQSIINKGVIVKWEQVQKHTFLIAL